MAKDEIIKLKLDVRAAQKNLQRLRSDIEKTGKAADKSGGRASGGLARRGGVPMMGAGGAAAGAAGAAGGVAVAAMLAKLVPLLESLVRSILPETMRQLEEIAGPAAAAQDVRQFARQAGELGIQLDPALMEQMFSQKMAIGKAGLAGQASADKAMAAKLGVETMSEILDPDLLAAPVKDVHNLLMETLPKAIEMAMAKVMQ